MGLLGEARNKHRQDLGGSVKLDFTHLSREAKMAIVLPNSLAEADYMSLALGPDHTLYVSSIRDEKRGAASWKVNLVRGNWAGCRDTTNLKPAGDVPERRPGCQSSWTTASLLDTN